MQPIEGFSKLSKLEKIDFLVKSYLSNSSVKKETLKSFWIKEEKQQQLFDEFSENTISNFIFP
ncbi:MAG: hydroxymethylglutaryl-CoA reductase, partial [Bdellovibrio sp. CG_4_9_14_3_um_filter_39_7]